MHNHPIEYPIVGTHESIYAITKEDLYKCYNTFYHPSNMFVVITGNVDYLDTLNIIKENQKSKNFENFSKIEVKKYKEEKSVVTKKQEIEMDISIPKVSLSYKIYIKDLNYNLYEINNYIIYYLDIKLGITSKLVENLQELLDITDKEFTDEELIQQLTMTEIVENNSNEKTTFGQKAADAVAKFAEEDKKKRESVDLRNNADQMVYQTEKLISEDGDKFSADDKSALQTKVDALKEALKGDNEDAIKSAQEDLQNKFYEVSQKLYEAAQQAQGGAQAGPQGAGYDPNAQAQGGGQEYTDADYTEVDDN